MSNPATSSGLKTASGVITALPATLLGLTVTGDGTTPVVAIIYDNPSAASGLVLGKVIVGAGERTKELVISECGVIANTGLYLSLSGANGDAVCHFAIS